MQDFRKLLVWQRAHANVLAAYAVTKRFPPDELYGLTRQVRRSAASVSANIAEGCGRRAGPDSLRFYDIAMGSAAELENHMQLARDLGYVDRQTHAAMAPAMREVKRMLASLIRTLRGRCGGRDSGQGVRAAADM